MYGEVVGIEPVAQVVEYAKQLYPGLNFVASKPENYLAETGFAPFDLVVCSEVIEHIPYEEKEAFMNSLNGLLKSNGSAILTLPRGERFQPWLAMMKKKGSSPQPVEDWLTKEQLLSLAVNSGFRVLKHECFCPIKLGDDNRFLSFLDRVFQKLLAMIGYKPTHHLGRTIYQLVWLKKED